MAKGGSYNRKKKGAPREDGLFFKEAQKHVPGNILLFLLLVLLFCYCYYLYRKTLPKINKNMYMSKNQKDTIHIGLAEGFPGSSCVE